LLVRRSDRGNDRVRRRHARPDLHRSRSAPDVRGPPAVSFFFNYAATTDIYTLSLHDALPISTCRLRRGRRRSAPRRPLGPARRRSEEHTSELQSRFDLVCRLLLEKKKKKKTANKK